MGQLALSTEFVIKCGTQPLLIYKETERKEDGSRDLQYNSLVFYLPFVLIL